MPENLDRLYNLLPVYIRQRDVVAGQPLRALLQVISEQVTVLESDIGRLYANWFIETCEDWVVPYIGDLIGYETLPQTVDPGGDESELRQRNRVLVPRRDVANLIFYRKRKGTLALLEQLAHDVAGWPARAVEFGRLLSAAQSLHHLRPERGRFLDLRQGEALDLIGSPFDMLPHSVDVRRIASAHRSGRYNVSNVGVYVFRLKAYSVTRGEARCMEEEDNAGEHCFTFSQLGNNTALFRLPSVEANPSRFSSETEIPGPIRRRAFEERIPGRRHGIASALYYGEGKSVAVWAGRHAKEPIARENIIPANLAHWRYHPPSGCVAVDPELGRICFHPGEEPEDVIVSYYYGFSDDVGGGEYPRRQVTLQNQRHYTVESGGVEARGRLRKVLEQWKSERPERAVIEILDSQTYSEDRLTIDLGPGEFLEIRAAEGARPVLRIVDTEAGRAEAVLINGNGGGSCVFDGITLTGRGMHIRGQLDEVVLRDCTLVPGWGLHHDCRPRHSGEASILLFNTSADLKIERSILGSIRCEQRERRSVPNEVEISDSIVDGTAPDANSIWSSESMAAFIKLTVARSTLIGRVVAHQVELAENCIFTSVVKVARRQSGCIRFCYLEPGSATLRRYHCQPDLAIAGLTGRKKSETELLVAPVFNSLRYGMPGYCQLAESCPEAIRSGADGNSEMGVFHNLFQPQRFAGLQMRLKEYVPAGSQVEILVAS